MNELNILIPTYNDEKSLIRIISEINIEAETILNFKLKIIIIDDGSSDELFNESTIDEVSGDTTTL